MYEGVMRVDYDNVVLVFGVRLKNGNSAVYDKIMPFTTKGFNFK